MLVKWIISNYLPVPHSNTQNNMKLKPQECLSSPSSGGDCTFSQAQLIHLNYIRPSHVPLTALTFVFTLQKYKVEGRRLREERKSQLVITHKERVMRELRLFFLLKCE